MAGEGVGPAELAAGGVPLAAPVQAGIPVEVEVDLTCFPVEAELVSLILGFFRRVYMALPDPGKLTLLRGYEKKPEGLWPVCRVLLGVANSPLLPSPTSSLHRLPFLKEIPRSPLGFPLKARNLGETKVERCFRVSGGCEFSASSFPGFFS